MKLRTLCQRISLAAAGLAVAATGPASVATQFVNSRDSNGARVDLAGRVTVINFWATWCVPCRVELPLLDTYYRQHRDDGLTVVAVAMDAGAPTARIKAATGSFAFPVVPVTSVRMPRRDIPNGLPVTRIYDRHGQLRFDSARSGQGTIDEATLDQVVAPLLRER